ncbi:MAG: enoyl-CoA hydratase/isomerase family protein [Desulfobacterales bacterium]|nr:enoyl-CoA hydratase/isomerase family protein [Desulfobacterales bacterium]
MLKIDVEDQIMIARLDDGITNAVTLDTLKQLKAAVDQVNQDPEIKGLILTGTGRFFSSGFSLPLFAGFKSGEEVVAFFEEEEEILLDLFTCKKPVVSAINGHCAAMGLIMSMAADYRIIKDHPKIRVGMSEIKIGLALTLAQAAVVRFGADSDKKYRDLMYFGEMMDVNRLKALEIVDEVVADDEKLIQRAKEIICLWIDTPNQPFVHIKAELKHDVAATTREKLASGEWKAFLSDALMNPEVKATLEFVHGMMMEKK